jgi:hypothetical protein
MITRKALIAKEWHDHIYSIPKRVTLLNSFWGFENPVLLPPNFIVTGPLMKNTENLMASLE